MALQPRFQPRILASIHVIVCVHMMNFRIFQVPMFEHGIPCLDGSKPCGTILSFRAHKDGDKQIQEIQ